MGLGSPFSLDAAKVCGDGRGQGVDLRITETEKLQWLREDPSSFVLREKATSAPLEGAAGKSN